MDYQNNYGQYNDGGFDQGETSFLGDQNSSQKQGLRTSITPVTIKQINNSAQPHPDGDFEINGVTLNMVVFVGVLRKVDLGNQSAVTLTVEDGSGSIDVRKWIVEGKTTLSEETAKYSDLKDKYVKITGALKEFNEKKNIQNATINEITDHNEVVYHGLSAISVHLKSQGITKPAGKNDLFVSENDNTGTTGGSLPDQIVQVIKTHSATMTEGVPLNLISQVLNINNAEANSLCMQLVEVGKIFSAYDDNSFLCI